MVALHGLSYLFQGVLNAGYGRQTGINPIFNDQGFSLDQQYIAASVQFGNDAEFIMLSEIGETYFCSLKRINV